jgi:DNA invertase Pin-like site-specific DNA recombinase
VVQKLEQNPCMIFGYARVSTGGQSVAAQERQLRDAGVEKVFPETAGGDVLLVTRLDRLARSTRDLLTTPDAITTKGALFRSLVDTWADTTTAHGRLILTVLGGLERELIRARTAEGCERAKSAGVYMGRHPILTEHQRADAQKRRAAGRETIGQIARSYNVSRWTIQRLKA